MEGRPREESDQLPEEGPGEQVIDEAGGATRPEAEENPGARGDEDDEGGQATGNPRNAG